MNKKNNILKFKITSSTNDKAKEILKQVPVPEFTVIFASEQIKGRGQRKNTWYSEANKNLTFSIITKPIFLNITSQFYLSKVISLGLIDYLNLKKDSFQIKWPNDILYNNKKICGILIENSISGSIIKNSIIGVGLNINQKTFPTYLPNAISLSKITNKNYKLEEELIMLLNYISNKYRLLIDNNFAEIDNLYHKYLYKLNEISYYKDASGIFKGKITGTLSEGRLIIKTSDNEIRYYDFKEVEFL